MATLFSEHPGSLSTFRGPDRQLSPGIEYTLESIRLVEGGIYRVIYLVGTRDEDGKRIRVTTENAPQVDLQIREKLSSKYPQLNLIGHNED